MTEIREFEEGDMVPLAEIVCRIWEMDSYGPDIGIPASMAYVRSCIARSTFVRTLLSEGSVVGCVMARAGDFALDIGQDLENYGGPSLTGYEGADRLLSDMTILDTADVSMKEEAGVVFDGELVLLILSEEAQGHGFGTILFRQAEEYFREQGSESVLIYTDDDCGYGFYDRLGARCIASRDVRLASEDLHMMLYRYIVI